MESSTKRILAIETTDSNGSVALYENDALVVYRELDPETRSARSLAPTIKGVLQEFGWKPTEIDVVGVAIGPGSFMGLRVGVATAKTLAWSVGAEVVGVDALDAVAWEADRSQVLTERLDSFGGGWLSLGIDAQRGDAAIRDYWIERSKDCGLKITPALENFQVVSIKSWLDVEDESNFAKRADTFRDCVEPDVWTKIKESPVYFAGPALTRVRDLETRFPSARLVEPELWRPNAKGVGRIAQIKARDGFFDNVWALVPLYSRKAAAEERRLEKEQAAARG